ncbi:MAG: DNA methyltransferase, partial [Rhabdochlamydiaceae bacterium]
TLLIDSQFATEKGMSATESIFGSRPFPNPKSPYLLSTLFDAATDSNDLILDSFAGSGTTAHAVLALNKEDGGNRKFILVEQEDYADTITAERVRRVIKGYGSKNDTPSPNPSRKREGNVVEGLGGSFSYYTLGAEYDIAKLLGGKNLPTYEEMASYCFFTATGENFEHSKMKQKGHFIGSSKQYDVYLFYEPDVEKLKSAACAVRLDWIESFSENPERKRLVFAPVKYAGQDYLDKYGFEYSQLPYEIYRRMTEN